MRNKYKYRSQRNRLKNQLRPPRQGFVKVGNTRLKHGISVAETKWLDKLGVPERSKVIRTFGNKVLIVDGYDPKTRTCWEYLGETFHGSHRVPCKNRDLVDPWLKKSPNQLYLETRLRFQTLMDLGFKVFFVWEYDDIHGKSLGRFYRGKNDNLY